MVDFTKWLANIFIFFQKNSLKESIGMQSQIAP
jgi:hypothetical protein